VNDSVASYVEEIAHTQIKSKLTGLTELDIDTSRGRITMRNNKRSYEECGMSSKKPRKWRKQQFDTILKLSTKPSCCT
jgi:hypothetical protein